MVLFIHVLSVFSGIFFSLFCDFLVLLKRCDRGSSRKVISVPVTEKLLLGAERHFVWSLFLTPQVAPSVRNFLGSSWLGVAHLVAIEQPPLGTLVKDFTGP